MRVLDIFGGLDRDMCNVCGQTPCNCTHVQESLRTENPCWKGYHPVGTKKKAGKTVPNCVPEATNPAQQAAIAIAKKKQQGVAEAKADPTSTWVVYDGDKVKRFKTHQGAKAYAEQHGGKVASSAHYADKIQGKQGVAEGAEQHDRFYVAISNEENGVFVGKLSKDGGKWREATYHGKPPHNWGGGYMSYLTPQDIMSWLNKDYGRYYEVEGPFYDDSEVQDYIDQMSDGVAEGYAINETADVLAGLTDILKIAASRQMPQNPRYFAQQVKDVALQLKDNPATQKWSNYLDGVVRWADVIASGKEQYSPQFASEVHSVLGPATRAYQDALLNKPGVAEGYDDDQSEYKLHKALVYNHGADNLKQQYEIDGDANKLIKSIQILALKKYKQKIDAETAHWIAKDLVHPAILEQGVAEGAYEDGVRDGMQGQVNRRASSIYGPDSGEYQRGYTDGVKRGEEQRQARVAQAKSDSAPYEKMSTEELKQMLADIQARSNERATIYRKLRGSSYSFDPKRHLPPNDAELKAQGAADNKAWNIIHQVLGQRERGVGEAVDYDQIRRDAEASLRASMDRQSDARIAHGPSGEPKKGFWQTVGDKQIGMIKGAIKGGIKGFKGEKFESINFNEDEEVQRLLHYARAHYPNSKDNQEAFMKYVFHALQHSQEDDQAQFKQIGLIKHDVDTLKSKTPSVVKDSVDSDEADYDEKYQQMVSRVGQKAAEQQRRTGPVDIADLARKLRELDRENQPRG